MSGQEPSRQIGPPGWPPLVAVGVAVGLGIAALVPVVVAIGWSWGQRWVPAGDWAMIELATADMGTADTRLLGPYSRMGWSHPGPLLFWLLAIPYRLSGSAPWGLLVGAGAINAASVAAAVWLGWRRGGVVLAGLVAVGVTAVAASAPTLQVVDPWNPWVTVAATTVAVLAAFALFDGDRWGLPVLVVAASFLVQSHVGFVPVVGTVVLVGVVGAWRRSVLTSRWFIGAGVVPAVVLWLPVAVDQLVGRGNLAALASSDTGGDRVGLVGALGVAARQLAFGGPWRGGDQPIEAASRAVEGRPLAVLVVPLAVFVAALGAALWRRCGGPVRLQATVGAAVMAGVLALALIGGPPFDYLVVWWRPLAALWWVSAGWSLWQATASLVAPDAAAPDVTTSPALASVGGIVQAVAVAALAVVVVSNAADMVWAIDDGDLPRTEFTEAVTVATDAVVAGLGGPWAGTSGTGDPPVIDPPTIELFASGEDGGWVGDAMAVRLEAAGARVVVERTDIAEGKFGSRRVRSPDQLGWNPDVPGAPGRGRTADGGATVGMWVLAPGDPDAAGGDSDAAPVPEVPAGAADLLVVATDVGGPQRPVEVYVASPPRRS